MKTTSKYKINNKPVLAPTSMNINYTRQAKVADRSESGIYDDDRIVDGVDIDITFKPRDWPELIYITVLLSEGQYINFTYKSPRFGRFVTQKMYVGDRNISVLNDVEDESFSYFEINAHLVAKNGDVEV